MARERVQRYRGLSVGMEVVRISRWDPQQHKSPKKLIITALYTDGSVCFNGDTEYGDSYGVGNCWENYMKPVDSIWLLHI